MEKHKGLSLDCDFPMNTSDECRWWEFVNCGEEELVGETQQHNAIVVEAHHVSDKSENWWSSGQKKGQSVKAIAHNQPPADLSSIPMHPSPKPWTNANLPIPTLFSPRLPPPSAIF